VIYLVTIGKKVPNGKTLATACGIRRKWYIGNSKDKGLFFIDKEVALDSKATNCYFLIVGGKRITICS